MVKGNHGEESRAIKSSCLFIFGGKIFFAKAAFEEEVFGRKSIQDKPVMELEIRYSEILTIVLLASSGPSLQIFFLHFRASLKARQGFKSGSEIRPRANKSPNKDKMPSVG